MYGSALYPYHIYANKIRDLIFTYPYSTYDLLYPPQCAMTLVAGRPTANPPPSMPAPPGPPPGDCLQALRNKNRQSRAAAGCSGDNNNSGGPDYDLITP